MVIEQPANRCFEKLAPKQIEAALAQQSLVYLPLGALEYHGPHLPVGLDSFTAYELCLRAADQTGGLVFPPSFVGLTATIAKHPWTILHEDPGAVIGPIRKTLDRLDEFDVKRVVLLSGHFALFQVQSLKALDDQWNLERQVGQRQLSLRCLSLDQVPDLPIQPDHAGLFETSLLKQLRPDLVDLGLLPGEQEVALNNGEADPYGEARRDPNHPLFGIFGPDPRLYDESTARVLVGQILSWLVNQAITSEDLLQNV